MAYRMKFRGMRNMRIGRVVTKIVAVLIALWVGGEILTALGDTMNGTTSPFYQGLTIIGWQVGDGGAHPEGLIHDTSGNGVLVVVGLIGIASVVLEFVQFSKIG